MITAIIRNKENTLVLELPHSIYWNTIFLYRSRRQIYCFGKPPSVKCRQRNCLRKLSKNI